MYEFLLPGCVAVYHAHHSALFIRLGMMITLMCSSVLKNRELKLCN